MAFKLISTLAAEGKRDEEIITRRLQLSYKSTNLQSQRVNVVATFTLHLTLKALQVLRRQLSIVRSDVACKHFQSALRIQSKLVALPV